MSEKVTESSLDHRLPAQTAAAGRLDLHDVRERLASQRGPEFWRSLEELAQTPEFEEMLHREFPQQAAELPEGVNRRRFLQLMAASLSLGGLTACTRQPLETIVPYVDQPESLIPGKPLYFATSMPLDGFARPLLVESHMGRPTKVEGNPEHPLSRGASDVFAQASILTLYDPERSEVILNNGRIRTWATFIGEMQSSLRALQALGGPRLRVLTETLTSPSLTAQIDRLLEQYPQAQWHQYSPLTRDSERQGLSAAFGKVVAPHYDLSKADIVVGLDADFLTAGHANLRHARDFADRRRAAVANPEAAVRFYAAESTPTATGTLADHRLPLRAVEIGTLAAALAKELGIRGASLETDPLLSEQRAWLAAVAADLRAHPGRGIVVPGDQAPAQVHTLAHAINQAIGAVGNTVEYTEALEQRPVAETDSLVELVRDMNAGEVDVLLILGGNPVYDSPAELDFAGAMLKVERRVHWGLYFDETAELCQWHIPAAHYLESWGDSRSAEGLVCLQQPLIEPLWQGRTKSEVLSVVLDDIPLSALELARSFWRQNSDEEDFESSWRQWLHDGFIAGTAPPALIPSLREDAVATACRMIAADSGRQTDLEIIFRPDPTIYDGQFNNNGWLQECPKPLTKLTWDNAALIAPALAERLGLQSTEVVEVSVNETSLRVPVWVLPGHPDRSLTLHLGYGRRRTGRVGSGSGFSAYALRSTDSPWVARGATLRKTGEFYALASTQLHQNIELEGIESETRHVVRVTTTSRFAEDPEVVRHMGHRPSDDLTLYPLVEYNGHAWGLAVDLSACTGCNACVIACQAENNIPIVGKEMVAMGREMHWIRIDRYFQGDLDNPEVHHQPVMCMHCEQAPCEVVCPVAATVHSDEGLNDMVYNRCVGTRYCSNNCPYKVRRFNFLKYNDTESPILRMLRNPDVTVRSRGVMEKCTYCVQRINAARIDANRHQRSLRDGEIQTACQQSCPSRAIAFGDINDKDAEVSRWKANPLNYGLLEELGTRPRTTYIAKLRNPNKELEKA